MKFFGHTFDWWLGLSLMVGSGLTVSVMVSLLWCGLVSRGEYINSQQDVNA